jgi:hypothetical protein
MDVTRRPRRATAMALISVLMLDLGLVDRAGGAELIYPRRGGEVQLPATVAGDRVILDLPGGRVELGRAEIRKLVPGFWPGAEWEARRRQARAAGFAARFDAAWWAIENGLTTEVAAELRELRALDPGHAPTSRMVAVLDRLDRPCPDPDLTGFRRALGIATREARGPHVVLLHQHPDAEARERIELLERVITGYYLLFAAEGVELTVPRRRLVSAWFAERADYLAFLRQQDAEAFVTTTGYFHPTWDAVVACDARSTADQRAARAALDARRDELRRFAATLDRLPARGRLRIKLAEEPARAVGRAEGRALLERLDREIAYRAALLDLDWRAIDLGTAAHEMIHQLTADSGLLPRPDAFPHWLHEGLAAQFEVIRGGRWAGISRAHDLRLPDWRKIQPPPKLDRLVCDAGFGHGYRRDLYAQAWALVYYLRARHPREFLTLLDLLRSPGADDALAPPPSRGDRVQEAFRRAFGADLPGLERDWHHFLAGARTPLERHAPTPGPASGAGRAERGPEAGSASPRTADD